MKIGFIDSGLGGAKVLSTALDMGLAGQIYFLADLKNNPYGEKDSDYIKKITADNVEYLVNLGCEIIVIACNTATAVAIEEIRSHFPNIKIFGIEPAVKAITESTKKGIVLGTKVTLKEQKLANLISELNLKDKLILVPANDLVKYIENDAPSNVIEDYLNHLFQPYDLNEISHIILGCTHFPIVSQNIKNVVHRYNPNIKIVDGSEGLIKNVLRNVKNEKSISITLILTKESDTFINTAQKIIQKPFDIIYK